ADPKFFACLVRFESSSVPTTLPTAYDVYPLDGRHDGGYYTVKDCVTIDVLPRTPGNTILNTFLFGVIILIANILKRAFSSQLAAKLRNRLLVLYKPFFVPFGAVVYSVINIKLGEHIVALCQFIH